MGRVNNTSAGKAVGVLVPVFVLQAVCRVPVDSVCDSIVFGMVSTLLLSINFALVSLTNPVCCSFSFT